MKKIVSFEKEILFPTMIGEVTSISLNHDLAFVNSSEVEGNFIIDGTYKMTEASNLEEKFHYEIPVDISLMEDLIIDKSYVKIDDFFYSILNDDYLKCNIDVLIEGVENICIDEIDDSEEIEDNLKENSNVEILEEVNRECDGEMEKCNINLDKEDDKEKDEIKEMETEDENINNKVDKKIGSIFSNLGSAEETYKSYSVYIVQENDTLEDILNKYKITKEELEVYNKLEGITRGQKIVIPSCSDE